MNVLFLTIGRMDDIEDYGIYTDLLRHFRDKGHCVYTVSPYERRTGLKTDKVYKNGVHMLHVAIGNITKCNLIEKGISTLRIESKFLRAIRKYYSDVAFDLILYSTPPITFAKAIQYIKKRDNAKTYLLLKDIFPQNAVDMGILSKTGLKGFLYSYFRNKEKHLYEISDCIGCMSQANVDYILQHNSNIDANKVEVCPNCIEPQDLRLSEDEKLLMRERYGIPLGSKVFVYGGNLGTPQGIPFLIECLKSQRENLDVFFLIVGDGTEYKRLDFFMKKYNPTNVRLMQRLPKDEYDKMIAACDVGMIFLDHRFTIPNFPSRLLSYMQVGLPILACTDTATDLGKIIEDGGFGWWCESNDVTCFSNVLKNIEDTMTVEQGKKAIRYFEENYDTKIVYRKCFDNM